MRISCVFSSRYAMNEILLQKRHVLANQKDVILFHDNGRPHMTQSTQQEIKQ